jgi:hypothetical protein
MTTQGWAGPWQEGPAPGQLTIAILEGEGAINNNKQRVAREPIVQVEDENHKPIGGAVVTFTLPNQGASASFANGAKTLTVTTDSKGQAVARGLRPNNVNGEYQVRVNASYQGKTANTTVTQTNALGAAAGAAAGGLSVKLITILAIAGAAAAGGAIAATRGGGNNTPQQTPTTVSAGTPTVGGPR